MFNFKNLCNPSNLWQKLFLILATLYLSCYLGVDYSTVDNKISDDKENEIGANLGLGLSYFVSNNFAIEATWAGLGYVSNDNGGNGAEKTNSFGLGANLDSINIGVLYKF